MIKREETVADENCQHILEDGGGIKEWTSMRMKHGGESRRLTRCRRGS